MSDCVVEVCHSNECVMVEACVCLTLAQLGLVVKGIGWGSARGRSSRRMEVMALALAYKTLAQLLGCVVCLACLVACVL